MWARTCWTIWADYKNEALVKTAHDICRWHHERWDGRGYPDGLAGDDIPISAQIVSMADVYDALVSKRVYKAAYSPDTAVQMILHGDCGQFNPLLLECLVEIQDVLKGRDRRAGERIGTRGGGNLCGGVKTPPTMPR